MTAWRSLTLKQPWAWASRVEPFRVMLHAGHQFDVSAKFRVADMAKAVGVAGHGAWIMPPRTKHKTRINAHWVGSGRSMACGIGRSVT